MKVPHSKQRIQGKEWEEMSGLPAEYQDMTLEEAIEEMTDTLPTELEKRFDKQFSVVKYEQDGEKHEGFRTSKVPNSKDVKQFLAEALTTAREQGAEAKVDENTSDGYHTFKELYEFRKLYNAALFNEWANQGKYNVHKSTRHHDGEACFGGGWFIVMATLPTGQISNHYEMKDWDLFRCDVFTKAEEWDGHTAQDVLARLQALQAEGKGER